jgi:hypothetical protein
MKEENKFNVLIFIMRFVCIAIIVLIVYLMFRGTGKKKERTSYYEDIILKYDLDGDMSNDYYSGFVAGIQYAEDHDIISSELEDRLLQSGYDTGYWDGYDEGYSDCALEKENENN